MDEQAAIQQGDLLFSPYERSLRKGKQYGEDSAPRSRREVAAGAARSTVTGTSRRRGFSKDRDATMIHVVTFQPKDKTVDISALQEALKASRGWAHHIDNVWLVATSESAKELGDRLRAVFPAGFLLVVEFPRDNSQYHGWLPPKAWQWILNTRKNGW